MNIWTELLNDFQKNIPSNVECELKMMHSKSALTRFANSHIHQNVDDRGDAELDPDRMDHPLEHAAALLSGGPDDVLVRATARDGAVRHVRAVEDRILEVPRRPV